VAIATKPHIQIVVDRSCNSTSTHLYVRLYGSLWLNPPCPGILPFRWNNCRLAVTRAYWKEDTFPAFAGPLAPLEPAKTRLEMFNLNPNIAYRVSERASFATGLDYYRVRDATSDTQGVRLSGDGDDLGWNAAWMYVLDQWSFGLSYQSAVKVKIDGEFDATPVFGFQVDSRTALEFPDILRFGFRYQVNEKLAVELDVDRTGWSSFDKIVVKSAGNVPAAGISSGDVLVTTTNNWSDTYSYHVSSTWSTGGHWR